MFLRKDGLTSVDVALSGLEEKGSSSFPAGVFCTLAKEFQKLQVVIRTSLFLSLLARGRELGALNTAGLYGNGSKVLAQAGCPWVCPQCVLSACS